MNTKAGVGTSEQDELHYVSAVGVGPLRFGMPLEEVVEAARLLGETEVSGCAQSHSLFAPTRKIEISRPGMAPASPAITSYVSEAVGLFCIVADALHGPQVMHDGVPLVGRDLSELESELIACADGKDTFMRYSPEGYAGPDDDGIIMRGQRVGQILRSRPLFIRTRDGANTEWDSMPLEEWHRGQPIA